MNPQGKGGFKDHPELINRKGKIRSFDALRNLAQGIANETATKLAEDGRTRIPIKFNDREITIAETILRSWAQSKDPRLQMMFVEVAYGKVPANLNIHVGFEELNKLTDEELLLIAAGKDSE